MGYSDLCMVLDNIAFERAYDRKEATYVKLESYKDPYFVAKVYFGKEDEEINLVKSAGTLHGIVLNTNDDKVKCINFLLEKNNEILKGYINVYTFKDDIMCTLCFSPDIERENLMGTSFSFILTYNDSYLYNSTYPFVLDRNGYGEVNGFIKNGYEICSFRNDITWPFMDNSINYKEAIFRFVSYYRMYLERLSEEEKEKNRLVLKHFNDKYGK